MPGPKVASQACLTQTWTLLSSPTLVPGFMSGHPGHDWTLVSGNASGEDLLMHLHPVASPERVASVRVNAGAEVFCFTFAEHVGTDFAYEDADRAEALKEQIDLAAAATLGPTRVVLDRCGDLTVGSSLVVDPDGVSPREVTVVSWPLRRLKARLRGGRTTDRSSSSPRCEEQQGNRARGQGETPAR